MDPSKIVVAGGTGHIGRSLCAHFESQGREVVVLSRTEGEGKVKWDAKTHGFWAQSLEGAGAVFNLCGAPVTRRWTKGSQQAMEDSRVQPTTAIGEAVRKCARPPRVWVNASAVGYYGDTGSREASEATRAGTGFLSELCKKWEAACLHNDTPQTRKVVLRIGVEVGRQAPFTRATSLIAKLGLGATLGTGRQYISWIHEHDLIKMFEWCLYEPVTGAVNACAPHPVTNAEYMAALRRMYFRPALPAVPGPIVRLVGALFGKEPDLLLTGQRVVPEIALSRGFRFKYSDIQSALDDALDAVPTAWKRA